ncbi:MAG: hypothetical protein FD149_298 [Rhodospirillaceae bacterium]|nr:MAG: hypothetical protein FD149_298 [Rhodospirillaceae bacterium]
MAGAALFNPACYESGVDDVFFAALEAVAHDALRVRKGHEGLIEVNIHRLYLLAIKSLLT